MTLLLKSIALAALLQFACVDAAPAPAFIAPGYASEGPQIFTSHAFAPNTSIHLLPLQAHENTILLGGASSAELCPPPPNSCPELPPNPEAVTAFEVFANGTGKMNSSNPENMQALFVTGNGMLAYLPANITSSVPQGSYAEHFSTFVSPPRGLNATNDRTWRFTGGNATTFYACKGSDFSRHEVWADTDDFDGSLFQEPCVPFVAVAVAYDGKAVWQYD